MAIASVALLAIVVFSTRRIGEGSAAEGQETPRFTLPSRGILLLAVLCLLVMVTEGAIADWGGLYLRQDLGTSAAVAALAFTVFAAGMTVGRVFGDWINGHLGPVAVLRWGALLTGIPLAALLLIGTPAAALAGMFAVGLGVSNGVPLMFSAAGRQPDTPPGPGIAAVSSLGSLGFLAGPPFIGVLADAVSLPWALATLILGAIVVFALARRAAGQTLPEPPDDGRRVRRGDLRPRRRARRLLRADRAQLAGVGRAPRARRRGDPGRQPRAPGARGDRRARGPARVDEEATLLAEAETTDTDGVVAYPGAGDVLALPRVAIATSCSAPLARARLAAAGLPEPDVLVTADQVEHGKPAPDPYLLAAERLGVDPAACVVLEDAPAGIASGRAAGMTVWAVTTTHAADALGGAARVAGGLPEHLAALRPGRGRRTSTAAGEERVPTAPPATGSCPDVV